MGALKNRGNLEYRYLIRGYLITLIQSSVLHMTFTKLAKEITLGSQKVNVVMCGEHGKSS